MLTSSSITIRPCSEFHAERARTAIVTLCQIFTRWPISTLLWIIGAEAVVTEADVGTERGRPGASELW